MIIFKTKNLEFIKKIKYKDLEIQENLTTFIIGESGCGKSSFLKLLNNTNCPSTGEIYYLGKKLSEYNPIILRKQVLLVGQNSFLFNATINENFKKYFEFRKEIPPDEKTQLELLKLCNINFGINKSCTYLSGGEKQRIFLAISLSLKPKVLLLDEPSSALDNNTRDIVIGNIIKYCKTNNISTIIVSHDETLVNKFSENTLRITE